MVIDIVEETQKKQERAEAKKTSREEAIKEAEEETAPGADKPLSADELSKK
jgi:hypothetical protein